MDLNHFEYLLLIAKYKNITEASNHLYISPSALSKYLTNLESKFKFPLFIREGHKLIPTKYGEEVISYLTQIDNLNTELDLKLKSMSSNFNYRFKIGFQTSIDETLIQPIFLQMLEKYPNLKFSVIRDHQENLIDDIKSYKLDVAIITLDEDIKDVNVDLLASSEFVMVANNQLKIPYWEKDRLYPWVKFDDIQKYSLITVAPGRKFGDYVKEIFKNNNLKYNPKIQVSTTDVALNLASREKAYTFSSEIFVKKSHFDNLKCFSFGELPIKNNFCLISRKNESNPKLNYFKMVCEENFK